MNDNDIINEANDILRKAEEQDALEEEWYIEAKGGNMIIAYMLLTIVFGLGFIFGWLAC